MAIVGILLITLIVLGILMLMGYEPQDMEECWEEKTE